MAVFERVSEIKGMWFLSWARMVMMESNEMALKSKGHKADFLPTEKQ